MDINILKIAEAIAKGTKEPEIQQIVKQSESEIKKEIDFLIANRDKALDVVKILFPAGIPINPAFYKKLKQINQFFGFQSLAYPLTGLIWVESYKLLPTHDAENLLMLLASDENVNFFMIIPSLPFFLSQTELTPDFAATWFHSLSKKVANDLAGGGVFQGIENYAYSFPDSGLRTFQKYIAQGIDQSNLHISAIILGALRASADAGFFQKDIVEKWDNELIQSPRTELRLCYYRSWLISCWRGSLSIDELEAKLNHMAESTQEEITEAFNILYRCLLGNLKNSQFISFACRWFQQNIKNNISELAKYYVVHSVFMLTDAIKENLIDASEADKLIIKVQPISTDSEGIWEDVEHYLVSRLQNDEKSFYNLLLQIAEVNSAAVFNRFRNNDFEYLVSELQKAGIGDYVTEMIISGDKIRRNLGFILFEEIRMDSLSQNVLNKTDDKQLRMILLESKRKPFSGEDASRFFIMLEARFQSASPELINEFKQEMLMQAINYPGECLEAWKQINNPSELVTSVIMSAGQYFKKMQEINKLSAVSFVFPEFESALVLGHREFSRKISEGVEKKSTLASLFKTVQIIYGKQTSTLIEGKLSDPTPFNETSQSAELPRLELIDPEGMTIRRMQAAAEINDLLKTGE